MSAAPKTIAMAGTKTHEVTRSNTYFVYDADGTTPLTLGVEAGPATHTLTSTALLRAIAIR